MSESVLQNKFGGVNQRVLRTEALDFSVFDGCFPLNVGIQNRIYGKAVLQKFPSPIQAIFQYFTPQGYGQGIYQTNSSVDLSPWLLGSYNFPLNTDGTIVDPTSLEISSLGTIGSGGYSSTSGALGGTGISYRYHIVSTIQDLSPYVTNIQNYSGTNSVGVSIPYTGQQFSFPPYVDAVPLPTTNLFTGLNAGLDQSALTQVVNNLSPPPNNLLQTNQSATRTDTEIICDFSALVITDSTVLITLLGQVILNSIPTTFEFPILSILKDTVTPSFDASNYLQIASNISTILNFDAHGNKVDPADEYNFGTAPPAGWSALRQNIRASSISITQIKIYTCHLVVS